MRAALVFSALLVAAPAAAQGTDLGELRVALPSRATPASTYFLVRLDVPPVTDADVPAAAIPLQARYAAARAAVSAAGLSPTDAQRRAVTDARAALVASLTASIATLSRPALLRLGMLQHEIAVAAGVEAQAACVADPAADCPPEATTDDTAAIATWSRVTGTDVYAAHALYQRAESAVDAGHDAEARPLLVSVLELSGLPAELEATAALLLGTLLTPTGAADVTATFGRCASLGVASISPRCSLLGARALLVLGDESAALAALGPALASSGEVRDDARALAAARLFRRGRDAASQLPAALPAADRAGVLDVLATSFHDAGHLGWSLEALTAAQGLATDPARATRITDLEAERTASSETPEAYLRRAMTWCLDGVTDRATFTLRLRFGSSLPSVGVTVGTGSRPVARALGVCLGERGPEPESRLRGAYSVHVTLTGGS